MQRIFVIMKNDWQRPKEEKWQEDFGENFDNRRIMFKAFLMMKKFVQVYGNKAHERRMKERVTLEVQSRVEEMQAQ